MSKKIIPPREQSGLVKFQRDQLKAQFAEDELVRVDLTRIRPNPDQPRRSHHPTDLRDLVESIRSQGLLQPLVGRPEADGTYTLIAGHRRLAACESLGYAEVTLVVKRNVADDDLLPLALIENIQRNDLHPVDEAAAYQTLAETKTHEEIAKLVGKSRTTISERLGTLKLSTAVLELCGRIPNLSWQALLNLRHLKSEEAQIDALNRLFGETVHSKPRIEKPKQLTSSKENRFRFVGKTVSEAAFMVELRFRKKNPTAEETIEAAQNGVMELLKGAGRTALVLALDSPTPTKAELRECFERMLEKWSE